MGVEPVTWDDRGALEQLAKQYLEPLYGDQKKALDGWTTGSNHKRCWKYVAGPEDIAGIVAVSDKPNKDYVKLSTLIVDKPHRSNGIGYALLTQAIDYAKETGKPELSVTIAEDVPDSLAFFYGQGFGLKAELLGRYRLGKTEYVLVRKIA